jgi:molybdopterin molybdotransferase
MISLEEALEKVLYSISETEAEVIPLLHSPGRTASENIHANNDLPAFDTSAMDGFAVRSGDISKASNLSPVSLDIVDSWPAGSTSETKVDSGTAIRIMTGAPIPDGANAVLKQENTEWNENSVLTRSNTRPGTNIRKMGSEIQSGDLILGKGSLIGAKEIGLLAYSGIGHLKVFKKPKVAILATGDELIELGVTLNKGQIRCSNLYIFQALVKKYGGKPDNLGIAKDDLQDIQTHILAGSDADIIVTTGGTGSGDKDFVDEILNILNVDIKYRNVAMYPGGFHTFGLWQGKLIFCLPGNTMPSFIAFEQVVRPAILRLHGIQNTRKKTVMARLKEDLKGKPGLTGFVPAWLNKINGQHFVSHKNPFDESKITYKGLSDGIILVAKDIKAYKKNDIVEVQLLG